MTPAATAARPAPTLPLDVLQADLTAIDTAILSFRLRVVGASGRDVFDLQRYLDAATKRRAAMEAEIANLSNRETTS